MINDSCILENNANCIFYASCYTITLSNCTIDKTTSAGSFNIQNTVTKSFIHALNHMSTRNCHSEYDAAGYLAPVIQTPSPSKKQKHLCTCGNLFYQYQTNHFVSLLCVFLFHFIHLEASNNHCYQLLFLFIKHIFSNNILFLSTFITIFCSI